ncbi:MAG: hypothetical protein ACRDTG_14755 [Pseudonocardiaceae bacterium]
MLDTKLKPGDGEALTARRCTLIEALAQVSQTWLRIHDIAETTRQCYESYTWLYLYPTFGDEPVGKITARVLEELYAELRRYRDRCDRRPRVDHRIDGPHECRTVRHRRPRGRPPVGSASPTAEPPKFSAAVSNAHPDHQLFKSFYDGRLPPPRPASST